MKKSVDDVDAHVAGGAGDDLDASGLILGVHVGLLDLPDLGALLFGNLTNFILVRLGRAAGDIGSLLEED